MMPEVEQVLVQPHHPEHVVIGTRYGSYYVTEDAGAHFYHVCQAAIGYDDTEAYPGLLTADGSWLISTGYSGIARSVDACNWENWAPPETAFIAGLTAVSDTTFVALNAGNEADGFSNRIWVSTNRGASWQPQGTAIRSDLRVSGLAALDSGQRLFVTAQSADAAELVQSSDAGNTWTTRTITADALAKPVLVGVRSGAPERVIVLLAHPQLDALAHPDTLLVSEDGGISWHPLFVAKLGLLSATLSEDGTLFFGSPADGVWFLDFSRGASAAVRVSSEATDGLVASNGLLFSKAHEAAAGYSLGVSRDRGRTFQPFFSFCDAHAELACAPDSNVAELCPSGADSDVWQPLASVCRARAAASANGPGSSAEPSPEHESSRVEGALCSLPSPAERSAPVFAWAYALAVFGLRWRARSRVEGTHVFQNTKSPFAGRRASKCPSVTAIAEPKLPTLSPP